MSTSKKILSFIISEKSRGNTFQELNIQMRIMMKGINVRGILEDRIPDDPATNEKLKGIAVEYDVDLEKMP